jgi:hypothetical protein
MKIGAAFPSKYLRAADIPEGRQLRLTIDHVVVENVAGNSDPDDEKPVLYFQGKTKGVVLNKTNANIISAAYGDETEEWSGKGIILFPSETQFQGKLVPCLRVKADRAATVPNGGARMAIPPKGPPLKEADAIGDEAEFNEADIPF